MQERRKIERQRTFLGALIVFNERTSTMECVVRNLSSEGARLSFDETQTIPERFELTIHRKKSTRCARIAWRGPTEAGLAFEGGRECTGPARMGAPSAQMRGGKHGPSPAH